MQNMFLFFASVKKNVLFFLSNNTIIIKFLFVCFLKEEHEVMWACLSLEVI